MKKLIIVQCKTKLKLLLFFFSFIHIKSQFILSSKTDNLIYFVKNSKFYLTCDKQNLKSGEYPVLYISIKYEGEKQFNIKWDNDFSRVLWEGDFILTCKYDTITKSTEDFKFKTSNTYEVQKNTTLNSGDSIFSILSFKELPGNYLKNIFPPSGEALLRLYFKIDDINLMPIGKPLKLVFRNNK